MKKIKENKINYIGIIIALFIFGLFYILTTYFLDKRVSNNVDTENKELVNINNEREKKIVSELYSNFRIMYDVVNNKFIVKQDEIIIKGDITFKRVSNFDTVMNEIFTENGILKYLDTFSNYFIKENNNIYLAGNLVSYQTYYFRGDSTDIYIIDSNDEYIRAIISEKWTSNGSSTLALVDINKENNKWLVDDVEILSSK